MMNKPFQYVKTQKQGGFALFLVLVAMLVIAFLVVATLQSTNMESRSSANDADRKVAMTQAESALNQAEDKIRGFTDATGTIDFKEDCPNGYCAPHRDAGDPIAGIPATITSGGTTVQLNIDPNPCTSCTDVWLRKYATGKLILGKNEEDGHSIKADDKSRYVIEFLGTKTVSGELVYLFRITAKGWGENGNTQVLLQSNVEATFPS